MQSRNLQDNSQKSPCPVPDCEARKARMAELVSKLDSTCTAFAIADSLRMVIEGVDKAYLAYRDPRNWPVWYAHSHAIIEDMAIELGEMTAAFSAEHQLARAARNPNLVVH